MEGRSISRGGIRKFVRPLKPAACLAIELLSLIALVVPLSSCDEDCYEDPNLTIPPSVYNISLGKGTFNPTYIGPNFYPFGTQDVLIYGSVNKFYSVERFDATNGNLITFFWSESTPSVFSPHLKYPFSSLAEGETVTIYVAVFNNKVGRPDCIYEEAKEVRTILKVNVRVENGVVAGTQTVEQTKYQVPAGKYAVFDFPVLYKGLGDYLLDFTFDSNGSLVETSTTDNNYSVNVGNLETD
jgi:hypothetical protein